MTDGKSRIGPIGELVIVFGLCVGLPLAVALIRGHGDIINADFGQQRLLRTLAIEIAGIAALAPWLSRRGWSFARVAGPPHPRDVLRGLGLFLVSAVVAFASAVAWWTLFPGARALMVQFAPHGSPATWLVVAISVINPIVEELLWLGYGFNAIAAFGEWRAIWISAGLRVVVHLYQGVVAFSNVLPLAVVFTVYYARRRSLWPVVVAHVFFDAIALATLVYRSH